MSSVKTSKPASFRLRPTCIAFNEFYICKKWSLENFKNSDIFRWVSNACMRHIVCLIWFLSPIFYKKFQTLAWCSCCVVGCDHWYFSTVVPKLCILFSFHSVVRHFLLMHNNFRSGFCSLSVLWNDQDFHLLRGLDSTQLKAVQLRFSNLSLSRDQKAIIL